MSGAIGGRDVDGHVDDGVEDARQIIGHRKHAASRMVSLQSTLVKRATRAIQSQDQLTWSNTRGRELMIVRSVCARRVGVPARRPRSNC